MQAAWLPSLRAEPNAVTPIRLRGRLSFGAPSAMKHNSAQKVVSTFATLEDRAARLARGLRARRLRLSV
eukprot:6127369-Alexandrium_andersonii.AAC.1